MGHRIRTGIAIGAVLLTVIGLASCSKKDSPTTVKQFCADLQDARTIRDAKERAAALAAIDPPPSIADEWKGATAKDGGSAEDGRKVSAYIEDHCRATGMEGQAAAAACISEKRIVMTAAEAWNAQMMRYPSRNEEMLENATSPDDGFVVKPVLKSAPKYWEVDSNGTGDVHPIPGVTLPAGCS